MRYAGKLIYTITEADVGKTSALVTLCEHCNHKKRIWLAPLLGYVQKIDVGKQIYETENGTLQVENNEQLEKRLAS